MDGTFLSGAIGFATGFAVAISLTLGIAIAVLRWLKDQVEEQA